MAILRLGTTKESEKDGQACVMCKLPRIGI